MANSLGLKAVDKIISNVLFSNDKICYRIPRFQRPYSWSKDNVDDLWTDVTNSNESYFIGSFVFNTADRESGYCDIIDGQQRLMTITILVAAIRDVAKSLDETGELSKWIQRHYISREDLHRKSSLRLEAGLTARGYFEKAIQCDDTNRPDAKTKEEKMIEGNYNAFVEKISERIALKGNTSDKIASLEELLQNISNALVIEIEIKDDAYAYEVFETVNARGVDLTVADLLKQLILKHEKESSGGKDPALDKWLEIETNILDVGLEMSKFVRHFWLSKFGFVGEKRLYKEMRKKTSDFGLLLESLVQASRDYAKLYAGTASDWSGDEDIFQSLQGLRAMKITQCYVLMMCLLRNRKKLSFEIEQYFSAIEKFSFNYFSLGNKQANKIEKLYSATAVAIEDELKKDKGGNPKAKLDELIATLAGLRIEEAEFVREFSKLTYKNSEANRNLLKYVLSKLSRSYGHSEHLLDFDAVSIEHMLPQEPMKWGLSKDDIKGYVHLVGNLTLIHGAINSKAQNKPLIEKVADLKESRIRLTEELVKTIEEGGGVWGESAIRERGVVLATKAYKIWQ